MPIYEYKCSECGHITEIMVSRLEEGMVRCENCGSRDVNKIVSASAISMHSRPAGKTCCGREERCSTPPCSAGGRCVKT